uniref:Pentatricopeptide repeat-containing protein n=1 Tax=Ananas comosus var. bracteatus TaxID=296719 RepID=A0A6V7PBW3_ANACO|nr:unnamed protein product [Ananas comosus var. bracteatus]
MFVKCYILLAFLHKKSTYFGFLQNRTTFFVFADSVHFFSKVTKIPLLSFLFPLFVSFVRFFFFRLLPDALPFASPPLSASPLPPLPSPPRLPLRPPPRRRRRIPLPLPPSPLLPSPFPPDTKVYTLLLRGWLKVRRWRRCRELWLDMDRNRVPKDLHSYSVYMDALSKSGKPWNAVRLFNEMSRKFAPDAVAYNTAIHALGSLSTPAGFLIPVFLGFSSSDKGILPPRAHGARPLGMRLRTRLRAASGEWGAGRGSPARSHQLRIAFLIATLGMRRGEAEAQEERLRAWERHGGVKARSRHAWTQLRSRSASQAQRHHRRVVHSDLGA